MKKTVSVILTLVMLLSLTPAAMILAAPVVSAESDSMMPESIIELNWMRSSEVKTESFVKPITNSEDAWNFSDVFSKTPAKYFESESIKSEAIELSELGEEYIVNDTEQIVGTDSVWDEGDYFSKYKTENGNMSYAWASWKHWGKPDSIEVKGEYSIRRFSTYVNLTPSKLDSSDSIILAPNDELGNFSYLFPINDNVFVFVNGELAFWGGTDVAAGGNQYGALNRNRFMGRNGITVRNGVNALLKGTYPHTDGWCIDLEENKDDINIKPLLNPGFNRIDIIADDYWEGGGMNRLNLYLTKNTIPDETVVPTIVPTIEPTQVPSESPQPEVYGKIELRKYLQVNNPEENIPYYNNNGEIEFELFKKEEDLFVPFLPPLTSATDEDGYVLFSGAPIITGETYYVKEKMTPDQARFFDSMMDEYSEVIAKDIDSDDICLEYLNSASISKASDLNWNNGNKSGLNSFEVEGIQIKANKSFRSQEEYESEIQNAGGSTPIFTVIERNVIKDGEYVKAYKLKVGIYENDNWKLYDGDIIVDNPGGHNDRQYVNMIRIK